MRDPAAAHEGASVVRALALVPLIVSLLAALWAGWLYITKIDISDDLRATTGQHLRASCPAIAEPDEYEKFEVGTGSPVDAICPDARADREDSVAVRRNVAVGAAAFAAVMWAAGSAVRSRARSEAERLVG